MVTLKNILSVSLYPYESMLNVVRLGLTIARILLGSEIQPT